MLYVTIHYHYIILCDLLITRTSTMYCINVYNEIIGYFYVLSESE